MITGRLFGCTSTTATNPASGLPVRIELGEQLTVFIDERPININYSDVSLSLAGFDEKGVRLSWLEKGCLCECHIEESAAVQTFYQHPPALLIPQLEKLQHVQKKRSRKYSLTLSALLIFLAAPLFLFATFLLQSDAIANKLAHLISIEQEQALGNLIWDRIKTSQTLIQKGDDWQKLNKMGRKLTETSLYPYTFHIIEDPTLNAFAIPGGIIVFHQGLLQATDDWNEVAGVLAHEIQHVEQRHSLKALIKKLGLTLAWAIVTGDLSPSKIEQLSLSLVGLRFSRDMEREADELGIDLLIQHQQDPRGMIRFFERLDATLTTEGTSPAWLSTHPSHQERATQLLATLERRQRKHVTISTDKTPLAQDKE